MPAAEDGADWLDEVVAEKNHVLQGPAVIFGGPVGRWFALRRRGALGWGGQVALLGVIQVSTSIAEASEASRGRRSPR